MMSACALTRLAFVAAYAYAYAYVCGDEDMKGRTSVVNGTASLKTFKNEDIKDLRLIMQWVSVGGTILTLLASCAFLDAAG